LLSLPAFPEKREESREKREKRKEKREERREKPDQPRRALLVGLLWSLLSGNQVDGLLRGCRWQVAFCCRLHSAGGPENFNLFIILGAFLLEVTWEQFSYSFAC